MLSTTLYKRETLNFVHMLDKIRYRELARYNVCYYWRTLYK